MTPDDLADDVERFAARGFGRQIGFGRSPAIISIDFINGFTDPGMPLGSDLDVELDVARKVLEVARAAEVPIIHTVVQYDQEDLADAGVWALKQAGAATLKTGSRAVALDERVGRSPSEHVLVKKYASAFFGTDLPSRLVSLGVDTVILLGCTTSGCVRATAVDAVQYGFRPMVVADAVGDRSAGAHRQALFDLHQKYADVIDASKAEHYLRTC